MKMHKEKLMRIFNFLAACVCMYILSRFPVYGETIVIQMDKIFSLIYFFLFIFIGKKLLECNERRRVVIAIVIAMIYSFCIVSGQYLYHYDRGIYLFGTKGIVSLFLVLSWIGAGAFVWFIEYCEIFIGKSNFWVEKVGGNKKFFIKCWCLIVLVLLPVFLAVYPGIYSYDASQQVAQVFGENGWKLTTHHPVIHTLFFAGCLQIGKALGNDYNLGMAVYSCVQAIIISGCYAYALSFLRRLQLPKWLKVICLLLFVLNPITNILVFVTTKDILFGGMFLVFFVLSLENIFGFPEVKDRKWLVKYLLFGVLMCLFRNQGVYVLAFTTIFLLLFKTINKKRLLISNIIVIILVGIINGPFMSLLGVQKGNSREMLSVPMQQIAKVYNEEEISDSDKQLIEKLISKKGLDGYNPQISDPVKSGFRTKVFSNNKVTYLKLWLKLGIQYPKTYFVSFVDGCFGYWYIDESPSWGEYILFDGAFMDEEANILDIARSSKLPKLEEALREQAYNLTYRQYPIIGIAFNQAFPFWILILGIMVSIYKKRYQLLIPYSLLLGYWLTLLLGPVVCVRYAYPLMICSPCILGVIYKSMSKVQEEENERNSNFNTML